MNRRFLLIIAALLGSSIYLISVHSPFIYDDVDQIVFNSKLHHLFPFVDAIFCGVRQIRVISNLSYAWNWALAGGATWPFHVTNIALHFLNTVLVWFLLGRMLSMEEQSTKPFDRLFLRDFSSFLFLIHPIQAEAVSYIGGRTSLLQAAGYLLALLTFSSKKRKPFLVSLIIAFSLLLKESCVLIPFVLLTYEIIFHKKTWKTISKKEFVLYFGTSLLIFPIYLILKDPYSMYDGTVGFSLYPIGSFLVWQARYYLFYLWILINPSAQSILHIPPDLSLVVWLEGGVGALLCVTTLIFAWRKSLKQPVAAFLVILFFVPLLPTNSFIQMINPFAEYRLYLSNLSLFFLVSWLLLKLLHFVEDELFQKVAIFIAVGFFCALSCLQQVIWSDEIELSSRAVENYPDSYRTHLLLGGAYEEKGNLESAREQYTTAMNLVQTREKIKTYRPWILLARIYLKQEKYKECLNVLDSIKVDTIQSTKPPLAYYQIYLLALSKLNDREKFKKLREDALLTYPGAELPQL
jgi:hypothetical protein